MSKKSRREFYERALADLRNPCISESVNYPRRPIKDASIMQRVYLRTAKLPAMADEDRQNYARLLRFLRATITRLDDKTSLPRDRMRSISHLLAAVELVRPDIQALWRKEFVALLAIYRQMARRYVKQIKETQ